MGATKYLLASLFFLGVAGVVAVGQHFADRGWFDCRAEVANTDLAETPPDLAAQAYEQLITGDFEAGAETALQLIRRDRQDPRGHALRGYALRGQAKYEASSACYTRAIILCESQGGEASWRIIDAYTGRAANRVALGRLGLARRDISAALKHAKAQRRCGAARARTLYQLAFVYSVRSLTREGSAAAADRHRAIFYLRIAMKAGFTDIRHIRADLDLVPIRGSDEFEELLR